MNIKKIAVIVLLLGLALGAYFTYLVYTIGAEYRELHEREMREMSEQRRP